MKYGIDGKDGKVYHPYHLWQQLKTVVWLQSWLQWWFKNTNITLYPLNLGLITMTTDFGWHDLLFKAFLYISTFRIDQVSRL